jgi:hypothetical protein
VGVRVARLVAHHVLETPPRPRVITTGKRFHPDRQAVPVGDADPLDDAVRVPEQPLLVG